MSRLYGWLSNERENPKTQAGSSYMRAVFAGANLTTKHSPAVSVTFVSPPFEGAQRPELHVEVRCTDVMTVVINGRTFIEASALSLPIVSTPPG